MRSYQVTQWGQPLEPRDKPTPQPQGTEVLVAIDACGVCHSDLHIWSGYFDLGDGVRITAADRGVHPPFTMGHEIVGRVAAVGPQVQGVALGEARIVFPWIGCGECAACARGAENLCPAARFLGARVDGGYADHVIVPHPRYLVDYEGVPADLACTYACSGVTAYSALKKVGSLGVDDHLLLIGAGGVGHNAIHLAGAVTPARVLVADVDPAKREAAGATGVAGAVDNAAPGAAQQVVEITGGGVAAAIDFVGAPSTFQFGIDVLRRGGTLIIVGLFGGARSVPIPMFPFRSLNVRGSYVGTLEEMHALMELVKSGRVPPIPVERRPMDEANAALDDLEHGRVTGRLVLTP
jgi:D-arabinose 1-dehydrogenase-like Zn-dependent alcohol dehydrogenase